MLVALGWTGVAPHLARAAAYMVSCCCGEHHVHAPCGCSTCPAKAPGVHHDDEDGDGIDAPGTAAIGSCGPEHEPALAALLYALAPPVAARPLPTPARAPRAGPPGEPCSHIAAPEPPPPRA
ncbi:hypothetical protein Hoch_3801 [Haliangium ochraceum DSM 14365]|uniref:Uncharacterized protein n=1 Tax=Haliangium ochraceum (strain DSM 14365 / JCM 11303 / SMP-2) TaxID=502025 RepID=D0LYF1_HALO1|nr:hypothetical protein Hoch_3801 [Haliangium ochraceum DSM 14365]